jgi:phosphatidylglycerophosphate synthase
VLQTSRREPQPDSRRFPALHGIDRWSVCNAVAALLAAIVSISSGTLLPALVTACGSMAVCLIGFGPRSGFAGVGAGNLVTVARLLAVACLLAVVTERGNWIAVGTVAVWVFDGVDGWLARRLGESSEFGAQFDMETDSHVMLLVCLHLSVTRDLGLWILAMGALRYVYVLVRWAALTHEIRERRSSWGRIVYSLAVFALALGCVAEWSALALPLMAAATLALCGSFAPDFIALLRPAADGGGFTARSRRTPWS